MKKGFTLIELLAVIVILAIIALIAIPIVIDIIDESKKNASLRSADNYIHALEFEIANKALNNEKYEDGVYSIDEINIEIKGEKPTSGFVQIVNGEIEKYSLIISDYQVDSKEEYDVWDGTTIPMTHDDNGDYHITKASELAWLAQSVNTGTTYEGINFYLESNIDLNDKEWTTIGTETAPFLGTFNGNGYKIKNLFISNTDTTLQKYNGLFGVIDGNAIIKNIIICNSNINISQRSAVIVGRINGNAMLENSTTYNNRVSAEGANIGALAGQVFGTLKDSKSIDDYISGRAHVGGITGYLGDGLIQNCYSKSEINTSEKAGGIVGVTNSKSENSRILNVISHSKITCQNLYCGGIVGAAIGGYTIDNAISYSTVNGKEFLGGIAGAAGNDDSYNGIIKNSKSYSKINASSFCVGGLVGQLSKKMENCYDYSSITVPGNVLKVGGISGMLAWNANIINTHAATIINGNKITTDKLIGGKDNTNHTLINVTIID